MLAEVVLLGSLAALTAGLGAAHRYFSASRIFKRTKLIPIGDATEGSVVRIRGLVRPGGGELLSAPLSGRPCVAWTLHVSQERGLGETAHYVSVLDERILRPFFVDDEDDTAFVAPEQTRMALIEDFTFDSRGRQPLHSLVAHLAAKNIDTLSANYVVREAILSPGEPITVVGKGRWESDPSRPGEGYRSVGKRFVIETGPAGHVHISDDPSLAQTSKGKKGPRGDGTNSSAPTDKF